MIDEDLEYWLERLGSELTGITGRIIRLEDSLLSFQQNIFSKLEKPMTEKTTFYLSPWPTLCDDCGDAITQLAAERTDLEVFMTFCPHRHTFALAYVGVVGGARGVTKWDTQSPLSEEEALAIMEKMGPHAEKIVNLDDVSLQ